VYFKAFYNVITCYNKTN